MRGRENLNELTSQENQISNSQFLHTHYLCQALSLGNYSDAILDTVSVSTDIELIISMFKTQVNFRNSVHHIFYSQYGK